MSERILLTPGEAADQLALSASALDRHTREGRIPYVRLGREVRYCLSRATRRQSARSVAATVADTTGSDSCRP